MDRPKGVNVKLDESNPMGWIENHAGADGMCFSSPDKCRYGHLGTAQAGTQS